MATPNVFDLLLITAQLSVGIAGFSTLATVFRQFDLDETTRTNASRVLNMLVFGLGTAALSLIPFVPHLAHVSDAHAWQISAATALVLISALAPQVIARVRKMRKFKGYLPGMTRLAVGFEFVAVGSLTACLLGTSIGKPSAMYALAVLCFLAVCGILFFGVIGFIIKPHEPL